MKLYPAERLNMGISAGAIAASLAVTTPLFASSLALGAAMEAVNFRFLHRAGELPQLYVRDLHFIPSFISRREAGARLWARAREKRRKRSPVDIPSPSGRR